MEYIKTKGKLLIIGGGEDIEGECLILNEFVRRAGSKKARIVILTTATEVPEKYKDKYSRTFERLGVAELFFIDVSQRKDAMTADTVKIVEKATGIFFTGGDQLQITSLMGGTALQNAIFNAYENGVIIAGTSAGAAMMGSAMIIKGDSDLNPRRGSVEIAVGVGLMSNCVIDTHFSQRGRHGRLMMAVADFPQHIGFGIDENTAIYVDKHKLEVIGEGAVTVFDGSKMSYSDIPYVEDGQSIALADLNVTVLTNTYKFDLESRSMIIPKEASASPRQLQKKIEAGDASGSRKVKRT